MKMIQRYFSLILLTPCVTQAAAAQAVKQVGTHAAKAAHHRTKTLIVTPLLKLIDGIPGIMDASTFKDCYNTWSFIKTLQSKAQHFKFQGALVSLQDLVKFEVKHKNIDKESAEWKEFLDVKKQFVDLFKQETIEKKKSVESSSAKEATKKIVDLWLTTQPDNQSTTSLLKNWGTPEEETALYNASAMELYKFMNDLCHFLEDFMYSCPKARADFESYLKDEKERAAFEKFFNHN